MISSFHLPERSENARRISSCMLISPSVIVRFSILTASYSSYLRPPISGDNFDPHSRFCSASQAQKNKRRILGLQHPAGVAMLQIYVYWIGTTLLCLLYLT